MAKKFYFRCPHCRNDESFVRPRVLPFGVTFGMGLLSALALSDYQNHRVICTRCWWEFRQPDAPRAPLARFTSWIVLVLAVFLVLFAFCGVAGLSDALPSYYGIGVVEDLVAGSPRFVAYLLVALVLVVGVSALVAGGASNLKLRRDLARTYRLTPDPASIAVPSAAADPARNATAS